MNRQTYHIEGMDCAGCARELETGVSKLPGVRRVQVDFATAKMLVEGEVEVEALRARVEALGKQIVAPPAAPAAGKAQPVWGFWRYLFTRWETRLALAGGGLALLALALRVLGAQQADALVLAAIGVAGYPIARSGLRTLWINQTFNINLLMTIAGAGAVFIGETLEAAVLLFLFAVGEALEGYTAERARDSLGSLLRLSPAQALRLGPVEEIVPVARLNIGDTIMVKPGERIPMDGSVTSGASSVNQAPITGESVPVYKQAGDAVFAGSVNGDGALHIRVTRRAEDNTLSRIIRLVEEAQSVRAPSQRLIDRFAQLYTPAVVVTATFVALLPPLLFNAPFYNTPQMQGWLYRALELLVIACPCALVISTPVTVISAITAAARRGVLIKGGAHLEALGQVRAFAFDKTGTLTRGQPVVTQVRSVDCATDDDCPYCDDLLALASAVEHRSSHPLAQAVINAARKRGVDGTYTPAEGVQLLSGHGVRGTVSGRAVVIGSHPFFEREHPHSAALCAWVAGAEAAGQTTMLLSDGGEVRGFIAAADQPRPNSAQVVAALKALDLRTVMLTGDNPTVAAAVARAVGIDEARAGLLPEDKVTAVDALTRQYQRVAMVGDGVNDTPALAAARVGIAMGGAGSAQALETADIALLADDLSQLPYAVRLARFTRRLIKQNVALSFGMKLAFIALALAGGASLWAAVFADVGMSLIVTLNGMRSLKLT